MYIFQSNPNRGGSPASRINIERVATNIQFNQVSQANTSMSRVLSILVNLQHMIAIRGFVLKNQTLTIIFDLLWPSFPSGKPHAYMVVIFSI
jgi:hypothetical protein